HAICFFAATFSMIIVVMDFNFLYRYWAVSNPHRLELFSAKWFVLLLFAIVTVEGAVSHTIAYFLLEATHDARAAIAPVLRDKYGIDAMTRTLVVADYWRDGHYNVRPMAGTTFYTAVLSAALGLMIYCGVGIVQCLAASAHRISGRTKRLQYDLFRMLTVQTVVPLCSVHLACASVLMLPMLGLGQEFLSDICPPLLTFFAPLDALAVILLMKDYRRAAAYMLTCG
ncbi:hypothetical protein PFISCL1PPCAC_13242, partial [Pristionchus fissidentatus]